jgi:hypothetical protein
VGNNPINFVDPTGHAARTINADIGGGWTDEDYAYQEDLRQEVATALYKAQERADGSTASTQASTATSSNSGVAYLPWQQPQPPVYPINFDPNSDFHEPPGTVFSVGLSGSIPIFPGFPFVGLAAEGTFDRVTMPSGDNDWFFTGGVGTYMGIPGVTGVIDVGSTTAQSKSEYVGLSVSGELDAMYYLGIGGDAAVSGDGSQRTVKYGPRFGTPGISLTPLQYNWTWDIGR